MDSAAVSRMFDMLSGGLLDILNRYTDPSDTVPVADLVRLYQQAHRAGPDPAVHARWVAERRAAAGLPPLDGGPG